MSGFTSFLKKAGQLIASGLTIVANEIPVLQPFLGSAGQQKLMQVGGFINTAKNDLTAVGTIAVQVEAALQGKTGADKLAAASALVAPIVRTSELVSGHQIANESEFIAGCTDLTNAVVRIMNSLKANALQTTGDSTTGVTPAPPAVPVPAAPQP